MTELPDNECAFQLAGVISGKTLGKVLVEIGVDKDTEMPNLIAVKNHACIGSTSY